MRSSPFATAILTAGLASALAAKPSQLVAVRNSTRHGRSTYNKDAAATRRETELAQRKTTAFDDAALAAAVSKRERRALKLAAAAS